MTTNEFVPVLSSQDVFAIPVSSQTVFAIPCNHPAASDGVFYCEPSFFNSPHMREKYAFLLVDTEKVIAELERTNPEMLEHASYKLRGDTAEEWLESTSIDHPRDMGTWYYSRRKSGMEFGMTGGQAALIKVEQEINLPCFPIAIANAPGWNAIEELRKKVGYEATSISTYRRENILAEWIAHTAFPHNRPPDIPSALRW